MKAPLSSAALKQPLETLSRPRRHLLSTLSHLVLFHPGVALATNRAH